MRLALAAGLLLVAATAVSIAWTHRLQLRSRERLLLVSSRIEAALRAEPPSHGPATVDCTAADGCTAVLIAPPYALSPGSPPAGLDRYLPAHAIERISAANSVNDDSAVVVLLGDHGAFVIMEQVPLVAGGELVLREGGCTLLIEPGRGVALASRAASNFAPRPPPPSP